jgi:hypothetical protein
VNRRRILTHPAFTGAVALLAVNDQVLKHVAPGWWSGKLSDFAGVFIVAILAGLVGRPRLGTIVTGVGFAALKLLPSVTQLAAPVLGGVTRRDPSDLVALLALLPAYRLTRHVTSTHERSVVHLLLLFGSLMAMTLSVTATSCAAPRSLDGFVVLGDQVLARIAHDEYEANGQTRTASDWARSSDGGRTWAPAPAPTVGVVKQNELCLRDGMCFRVVRGRRVEVLRSEARWRTAFEFSGEERRRMDVRTMCGALTEDQFADIVFVDVGGTEHVVVAMGTQGVLHRSPTGAWERRSVLDLKPISIRGASWLSKLLGSPLVLAVLAPLLWLLARRGQARRRAAHALAIVGFGAIILTVGGGALDFVGVDYTILGPAIAAISVAVFVLSLVVAVRKPAPERQASGMVSVPPRPDRPGR